MKEAHGEGDVPAVTNGKQLAIETVNINGEEYVPKRVLDDALGRIAALRRAHDEVRAVVLRNGEELSLELAGKRR